MITRMLFRPPLLVRTLLLVCGALGMIAPLAAQSPGGSNTFYGSWQMQEPAGDQCVMIIKRGNRASSFYIGSASSNVIKGTWEIAGDTLIVTWESGYRDVLKPWSDGTLERKAFGPEQSLNGKPNYETRAVRLDKRVLGSLAVERDPADRAPTEPAGEATSAAGFEQPKVPMRNPYIGYWAVEQSPGLFFGLIGDSAERFFLFLDRNGQASVALRDWGGDNTLSGHWQLVDGEARITWPSGHKDALVKEPNGTFRLRSYRRKDTFAKKPNETREARQTTPTEAAQYFNSGDVRLLTMTDIRGLWAPTDPNQQDQHRVHILGWGNAQLEQPQSGEVITRGTWRLFNDHVVVTWQDGTTDVLRNNLRFWVRDRFPAGEPVTGTPVESYQVTRVEGSGA